MLDDLHNKTLSDLSHSEKQELIRDIDYCTGGFTLINDIIDTALKNSDLSRNPIEALISTYGLDDIYSQFIEKFHNGHNIDRDGFVHFATAYIGDDFDDYFPDDDVPWDRTIDDDDDEFVDIGHFSKMIYDENFVNYNINDLIIGVSNGLTSSELNQMKESMFKYFAMRDILYHLYGNQYPNMSELELKELVFQSLSFKYGHDLTLKHPSKSEFFSTMEKTEPDVLNAAKWNLRNYLYRINKSQTELHPHYDISSIFQMPDFKKLSAYPLLSSDFIKKYNKELDWDIISSHKFFTANEIHTFRDKINFDKLKENPYLSESVIKEFNIDMSYLLDTPTVKEAISLIFKNKTDNYFFTIHDTHPDILIGASNHNPFVMSIVDASNLEEHGFEVPTETPPALAGPAFTPFGTAIRREDTHYLNDAELVNPDDRVNLVKLNLQKLASESISRFQDYYDLYEQSVLNLNTIVKDRDLGYTL